jgi:hypothetical protein
MDTAGYYINTTASNCFTLVSTLTVSYTPSTLLFAARLEKNSHIHAYVVTCNLNRRMNERIRGRMHAFSNEQNAQAYI